MPRKSGIDVPVALKDIETRGIAGQAIFLTTLIAMVPSANTSPRDFFFDRLILNHEAYDSSVVTQFMITRNYG
jgi:hypothetical protein